MFLLKSNINITELKLQEDEVQDVKWVTITEYEKMLKEGKAIDTSFYIFKEYYDKYYERYLVFEDGQPIYKKK